jgi:hypothetical protein
MDFELLAVIAATLSLVSLVVFVCVGMSLDAASDRQTATEGKVAALAVVVDDLPTEPCDEEHAEHRARLADLERWRMDHETRLKAIERKLAEPEEWVLMPLGKSDVVRLRKLPDENAADTDEFRGILADAADLDAGRAG